MFNMEWIAAIGIGYLLILFLIAYFGDSDSAWLPIRRNSNVIYALSLAVYCSSWTFYGAVGTAAVRGLDYLAIYFGPVLVFLFGYPLMRRLISICKQNSITTISDFISSRFGKSRRLGVLVTFIAVVGSLPYIALQLQAVSQSYLILSRESVGVGTDGADLVAFATGLVLALFAILFGTRHLDATEHHRGMVLAIAFESIIKLVAILAVGYYALYLLLGAGSANSSSVIASAGSTTTSMVGGESTWVSFLTRTLLSMAAIILLPRQFQVTVVESESPEQFKTAIWLMPIYLVLTSIIVIPIALAGMVLLPPGQEDMFVLNLPLYFGNTTLGVVAFIGGLSAATGMVIVAVISLSTMICNDWIMPNLIRWKSVDVLGSGHLDRIILLVRRSAILFLLLGAYGYYLLMDNNAQLANIGLVSFAAITQLLPGLITALYWQRAHNKGVFWGMIAGFLIWTYTLLLPTLLTPEVVDSLIGSSAWLHPQRLFTIDFGDSLAHGVFWSLVINIAILVGVSLRAQQSTLESVQANRFYNINRLFNDPRHSQSDSDSNTTVAMHPDALRIVCERVIGVKNTEKLFSEYEARTGVSVANGSHIDGQLLTLVQTAIAGVIGTASAQRVIADTITGNEAQLDEISSLVDASSSLLKFNRKLLETTLQNITHGIAVVDQDLNLVVWNAKYLELFQYPEELVYIGKPIKELLQYNAQRGDFGDKNALQEINKRLRFLQQRESYESVRTRPNGVTIKSTGEPMPGGGFVTTYEDITESVRSSELLRRANEELELRVRQRTRELEILTEELERNTRSKTHFLAAASHDLLQPINAARLFTQSIAERKEEPAQVAQLAANVDESLHTANQLLRALLDVSKLDAGGIEPTITVFELKKFVRGLIRELDPVANANGVLLEFDLDTTWIKTDQQLLTSVLQNLVGNAIRYTPEGGRVTVHTQSASMSDEILISVTDTGSGIAEGDLARIFNEFFQVKSTASNNAPGLGLGLSIVKRICRLLKSEVFVDSELGAGSTFSISVPLGDSAEVVVSPKESTQFSLPANKLQGVSILCLDNDVRVLNAMQTLLSGWGCEVQCVEEITQAWKLYQDNAYDLVLADYRLDGEQTGLDLLEMISNDERYKDGQVAGILITAEQDSELKGKAQALGFQYLAKPIQPAALKSLVMFLAGSLN